MMFCIRLHGEVFPLELLDFRTCKASQAGVFLRRNTASVILEDMLQGLWSAYNGP